ncbi:MAG TPA: sugar ABC transporter substrate-binding protein [Methylomirabilota bacterium]|jgi:multiple sugar transport system substrate-binding protein|nr:sugar ABC transporter substrate-binding protein [Methylomirabilota bacterium]
MRHATRLSRRAVLRLSSAALAGAAAGPFVWTPARAQGFNWKRFQGKELYLLLTKHPWIDVLEKNIGEFESLSGMKIKWETLPEIQARQKLTVEMTGGSSGIDAFFTSLHVEKKRFFKAGWYTPLNRFIGDPTLTSPEFDWNDVTAGAKAGATQADGSISALPAFVDVNVLFYRKDVFAQKGLTPPKTLTELEQVAQKLHSPPGTYGIVLRGLKNANATQYPSILFPMGGAYIKDGKAALDSKESVLAMDLYTRLLRQYGPPGVVNFNWYEASAAFYQGQVAMYMDGVNFASQFEDPAKSKVAGKVGYTLLPTGPAGAVAPIYITGMAVSSASRNKEAAYLFAQWATNKPNAVRELTAGVGVGRIAAWDDPAVKGKGRMPVEWYSAYQASLKNGRQGLPEIVAVTEYRDIIGVAIQRAIEGAPAAQVCAQAQKEFQELLDKTEG